MFAFAGLWEKWKDKTTGQVLRTYTILTTDPNELRERGGLDALSALLIMTGA
jgi:putative SOS response-associated peptidase YedK